MLPNKMHAHRGQTYYDHSQKRTTRSCLTLCMMCLCPAKRIKTKRNHETIKIKISNGQGEQYNLFLHQIRGTSSTSAQMNILVNINELFCQSFLHPSIDTRKDGYSSSDQ
ncbi:unnamed protein product [Amoebophrya sp. A25]|nr:unnamed protein product [Amoebophrya sp. A25]|eukprot:GSA25T00005895001.1